MRDLNSLEQRKRQLDDLEREVMLFRPADGEEPDHACVRPIEPDPLAKFARPRPRAYPPPALTPPRARVSLLSGHFTLVDRALSLERLILIAKMRLKTFHDQRRFTELRAALDAIESPEGLAEDGESPLKTRIRMCRSKIAAEKHRIAGERRVDAREHFAAVAIQSAFRGFLLRSRPSR
jgi:hypothetical protein